MTRAQGKHREFSLNQSVATLFIEVSEFRESEKSLKHELSSVLSVTCVSTVESSLSLT